MNEPHYPCTEIEARLGEVLGRVHLHLKTLPCFRRMLVEFFYFDDYSIGEIEATMGLPEPVVGYHLAAAQQDLGRPIVDQMASAERMLAQLYAPPNLAQRVLASIHGGPTH